MNRVWVLIASFSVSLAAPAAAQDTATDLGSPSATPDPAHLAAAERVALRIWPDGTWRRQMDGMMDGFFSNLMGTLAGSSRDIAVLYGKDSKEARQSSNPRATGGTGTSASRDMDRVMQATVNAMTPLMTEIEPQIRGGIAASAARRFTIAQLGEIETFFATSTGSAYANQSILIMTDPEVMQATMAMIPRMMESLPQIMEQIAAETGIAMPADAALKLE